jgi:exonuclease III
LDLIEHEFLDCDVICISESHLDKSIDNDKIKLKGFQNPVRLDRNRHGEGANIYVKKNLYYKVRTDLSVNNLEILWVEIRISNNEKNLVGIIYRPPNSIYIWGLFCESVDKALDSDIPLVLVGDYNCDTL